MLTAFFHVNVSAIERPVIVKRWSTILSFRTGQRIPFVHTTSFDSYYQGNTNVKSKAPWFSSCPRIKKCIQLTDI